MVRMDSFRAAVVAAREARGWTQAELAEKAPMSRAALSNLETGITRDPRGDTVEKLAKALGWTQSYVNALLRGEVPAEPATGPTDRELAVARQNLPRAPREVLVRYVQLVTELEPLWQEMERLQAEWGPRSAPPSTQRRREDS